MIDPTDQDIRKALRLSGLCFAHGVADIRADKGTWQGDAVMAHARTIAQLRVAVEALEPFANEMTCDEVMNNPPEKAWSEMTVNDRIKVMAVRKMERDTKILAARVALHQIRSNTDEQAD